MVRNILLWIKLYILNSVATVRGVLTQEIEYNVLSAWIRAFLYISLLHQQFHFLIFWSPRSWQENISNVFGTVAAATSHEISTLDPTLPWSLLKDIKDKAKQIVPTPFCMKIWGFHANQSYFCEIVVLSWQLLSDMDFIERSSKCVSILYIFNEWQPSWKPYCSPDFQITHPSN